MIQHAIVMLTELVKGALRFGFDRTGYDPQAGETGETSGGDTIESALPYGFRARPDDPDLDDQGYAVKGAGLLTLERGGADEAGWPTADARVELPDEGKGGSQIYGWAGGPSAGAGRVSRVVLFGRGASQPAGTVQVTAPGDGGDTTVTISPGGDVVIARAGGTSIAVRAGVVEVGGAGGVPIARAPEIQAREAAQDLFNTAVAALLNASPGPVLSAPGAVPVVPPLAGTVAATKATVT